MAKKAGKIENKDISAPRPMAVPETTPFGGRFSGLFGNEKNDAQ